MKLSPHFRVPLIAFVISIGTAGAQTLSDVLCSVQERKQVLEQAQAFVRSMDESPNDCYPNGLASTFELISWTGAAAYPEDEDLADLGIEERVRLLNEARRHFQSIRAGFVNVAPERIDGTEGASPPAVISRFDELSLPTPPVADHMNYLSVLRELACKVDAMRVTPWPVSYTHSTGTIDNTYHDRPQTEGADKIKWSEMYSQEATVSGDFWAPERPVLASFCVGGRSYEARTGTEGNYQWHPEEYRYARRVWPSAFTLSYVPAATLPAEVPAVQGTCVVLVAQQNSPYLAASGTGTPATAIAPEGGYTILASRGEAGSQAIPAPEWVVSGSWVSSGADDDQTRNKMEFKPTLATDSRYDLFFSSGGSDYKYTCVEQEIVFLLLPSFLKGLDKQDSEGQRTDYQWDRPRTPGAPGDVAVSGGAAKLSVGVGRGESMHMAGSIQIQHCWTEFPAITSGGSYVLPYANPEVLWAHPNASAEYLDYFTDKANHRRMPLSFATQLKFVGPERDYQVLYETRFDHGRASLKDWPATSLLDGNHGWQHGMAYYWEWQKPRLRQVLGREALIDVVMGDNDYTHTISVYRIPIGVELDYDTDGFVEVTALPLVKSVTLGSPTMDQQDFPTADLELDVEADGGVWTVAGSADLTGFVSYPTDWSVSLLDFWTSAVLLEEQWSSAVDYLDGDPEEPIVNWVALEAPITSATEVVRTMDGEAGTETTQTITFDSLRSLCADPLPRISNVLVEGSGGTANTEMEYATGDDAPEFPVTITSTVENEPEIVTQLDTSGLPDFVTRGAGASQWKAEWDVIADGRLVATSTFGGDGHVYGRNWIKWENGGWSVTNYSAPDGNTANPDDGAVAWTKLETGRIGGSGFPGLPHKVTRSDGTGTTFAWTIGTDGAGTLVATDGLMPDGTVTKGTSTTLDFNAAGYPTDSITTDVVSNLQLAGTTGIDFTDWGAPLSAGDYTTGLLTSWTYDNNLSRLATLTSPLGLTTEYSAFDALDRPGQVTANGITATNTFAGPGVSTGYSGTDVQAGTQSATTRDAFGRLTASNTIWNGVHDNLGLTYGTGTVGISRTAGPYGTHSASVRQGDGSLASASGPTLAFGGVAGNDLSIVDGLSVNRVEVLDEQEHGTDTYQETHADAWGRVCKVITPSRSGTGSTQASIAHSNQDSTLRRVITIEPSGRVLMTESDPFDASGAISRSGIDRDFDPQHPENAGLGGTDRYTESVTKVEGTKVVTTVKVTENSGLREILSTEWTPSTGITITKANCNEETITSTPDYTSKSVTTSSTKGWSNTRTVNNLGLSTASTLSGTGIPTTGLDPVWRADGSLASVALEIGGETHSAGFNANGTFSSLTGPGITFGGHSIANGVETLTVNGVTVERKLDDTQVTTSGADIIGKTDTLAVSGSGYQETVDPCVGANTTTNFNAAGSATGKNYAAGAGESYGYEGELLTSVSLARGGQLDLDYSPDGAKDLISAVWPTMVSGTGSDAFTIPAVTHGFGYDRAGRVDGIGDASGSRSLTYQNGRLQETAWTAGPLAGYRIFRSLDQFGRNTGFTLYRGSVVVHSAQQIPDGDSDYVSALASGALKVVPQPDAAGRITGFQWGNATGNFVPVVTQTWQRGTGGRIEAAGSDVAGAPSFDYLIDGEVDSYSFDTRGRHLKCATAAGTWTYVYTNGQLTSATHPTPGTFAYQFDGIGRRTNMGELTANDALNRALAWTHSQSKTLKVFAHPDAQVWVGINGGADTQIQGFNGEASYTITPPGSTGGWVPWHTLAVLPGAGQGNSANPNYNPLANFDANAEQSGAVWVPPVNESFEFDDAGNRESSALWNYGWDGRDMLVRARTKNHDVSAQGYDITCDYDAEGRRFKKNVTTYQNGSIVSQDKITFIWDGWDLIYERHQNPSGLTTLERKYVWGPDLSGTHGGAGGAGGLLLIRETRGTQTADYYPLYDGCGHVIALADSDGNLVAEYAYGPFGEQIHARGPHAQSCPFRYATKYYDSEMGLYYFGRRYLDPITAQWLNREPLGESESLNLYAYCHNDPVNNVDVLGLAERVIAGSQPEIFALPGGKDEYFIGWATEDDGLFHGYKPTGRYSIGGHPFHRQQIEKFLSDPKMICTYREQARLSLQVDHLNESIRKCEAVRFYAANIQQAASGVGEAVGGALLVPESLGLSSAVILHGSDRLGTAVSQTISGPGVVIQSATSTGLQKVGLSRSNAEATDNLLQLVGAGGVMYAVGKGPLLLTPRLAPAANSGSRIASEVGLNAGEITRIQNAANRIGKPINLVGSRASGTANAASDWDYVIEGMTNANKNAIKNSLPGAPIRADQVPRNIDFFTDSLRTDLPHIQFTPR